jgi:hypothetical protein
VPGWQEGAFADMDSWITFEGRTGWIETGSIVGWYSKSEHDWVRFNGRKSKLDGYNYWAESVQQTTSHYATYGLEDLSEEEAWDVLYEGLGYDCGKWCKVNRYGSWPYRFNTSESGMEVAAETEPTVEGAQSVGGVQEQASGIFAQGRYIFGVEGAFEAWCGSRERTTDREIALRANPDVGTFPHCGGAYRVGDLNILVEAPFAAPALKAAKPLNEAADLGKPSDATSRHEGAFEVLESKAHKFRPSVPVPFGTIGPSGHNEVIRRAPDGVVQALWVGEGKPDAEARKLLAEPQPEIGPPTVGPLPTPGQAGICYGC